MLIHLSRRLFEANAEFISSLAGGLPDASTDDGDDAGGGEPGAGEGTGGEGGDAAAAAAGTPGAAPGPSGSGPAGDANRDHVSNLNAALRQERAERKALEQRLTELEARTKPAAPAAEPEPDFLEDPKGVVDKLAKRLDESDKQRKDREEAETKQREQQAQAQQTWSKVIAHEQEFTAKTPDYHQALAHVRGILTEQVKLANPEATDEQIAQHIQIQEAQGAVHILRQGRNPSEVYYQYAQKLGYKPAGAPAAAANGAPPKVDKEAARTMGSGGGDPVEEREGRTSGLSELSQAHAELKEERKKNARSR